MREGRRRKRRERERGGGRAQKARARSTTGAQIRRCGEPKQNQTKGGKKEAKRRNTKSYGNTSPKPGRDWVINLCAERVNKLAVVYDEFVQIPFVGFGTICVQIVTQKVKSTLKHVKMDAPLFEGVKFSGQKVQER